MRVHTGADAGRGHGKEKPKCTKQLRERQMRVHTGADAGRGRGKEKRDAHQPHEQMNAHTEADAGEKHGNMKTKSTKRDDGGKTDTKTQITSEA